MAPKDTSRVGVLARGAHVCVAAVLATGCLPSAGSHWSRPLPESDTCDSASGDSNPADSADSEAVDSTTADTGTGADTASPDADSDGYTLSEGDCEDSDPGVHPGAVEVCGDGIDNDCDGADSVCSVDLAIAIRYDGVGVGIRVSGPGDVNGDGHDDILVGTPGLGAPRNPGAAFLVLGDSTPVSDALPAAIEYAGSGEEGAGARVAGAGDANGDGYADLLIGAMTTSSGTTTASAYLVLGSDSPGSSSLSTAIQFGAIRGWQGDFDVSGAGDVDDDGYDDIVVGFGQVGGTSAAYLIRGAAEPGPGDLPTVGIAYEGGNYTGESVGGGGDVNGDGYDDFLVGDPDHGDMGAVHLVLGGANPVAADVSSQITYSGVAGAAGIAGYTVALAGDVNSDGYDDMLMGTYALRPEVSPVYLVPGGEAPESALLDTAFEYTAEVPNEALTEVAAAGDLDDDGYADFVAGFPASTFTSSSYAGAAYVVRGSAVLAPNSFSMEYLGESDGDGAGVSVAGAGDVDADGSDDLLIGAWVDYSGDHDCMAYLLLGGGL